MIILILILMIYSVFGIHLTWTLRKLKNGMKITLNTNTITPKIINKIRI